MSHPLPTHEPDNELPEDGPGAASTSTEFVDRCMNVVAGGDPDLRYALTGRLPGPKRPWTMYKNRV